MNRYERVTAMLLVRLGFNAGQSVTELAVLAKKAPATIRRWLKTTGVKL